MKVLVAAVLSAGLLASGAVVVGGGGADAPPASPQGPFGCCTLTDPDPEGPAGGPVQLGADHQGGEWT